MPAAGVGRGTGPSRRSHTKSRNGCSLCKKRHIRCDERPGGCKNCSKHRKICPYSEASERPATPSKPNLLWNEDIVLAINQWKETEQFPFPELDVHPAPSPQYRSMEELRLIYHLAALSHLLNKMDAHDLTIWTHRIPLLLKIGATYDYVLQALMAFSAMHIASISKCPLVDRMVIDYNTKACGGLRDAILNFSQENSDAVLAASLVLSWQATDWSGWSLMMQGTSTVINAMGTWKHESQFGDFIEERSTFPTAPASPKPERQPAQPRKEDLDLLLKASRQLTKLETHLKQDQDQRSVNVVKDLQAFVKAARKVGETSTIAEQFERLSPLRNWLFFLPVSYLTSSLYSHNALVVLGHYYAVALLMERVFPDIGPAFHGSLLVQPLEVIRARLSSVDETPNLYLSLLEFPINTLQEFRSRMEWVQPARAVSFSHLDAQNFYMGQTLTPPVSTLYLPPTNNHAFSYSTEDLSREPHPHTENNAISPLVVSSPFVPGQYLSIPSPSYGSAYSPESSTFGEGSVVYSDNDEYASFAPSPVFGNRGSLDFQFVTPVHPVWI